MSTQRECKRRHESIAININWELCGKLDLEKAKKRHELKDMETLRYWGIGVFILTMGVKHVDRTFGGTGFIN